MSEKGKYKLGEGAERFFVSTKEANVEIDGIQLENLVLRTPEGICSGCFGEEPPNMDGYYDRSHDPERGDWSFDVRVILTAKVHTGGFKGVGNPRRRELTEEEICRLLELENLGGGMRKYLSNIQLFKIYEY
jgi:hypothetical protein